MLHSKNKRGESIEIKTATTGNRSGMECSIDHRAVGADVQSKCSITSMHHNKLK